MWIAVVIALLTGVVGVPLALRNSDKRNHRPGS